MFFRRHVKQDIYIKYGGISNTNLKKANKIMNWITVTNTEPDCPGGHYDYDIALLVLENDIVEGDEIKFIALYDNDILLKSAATLTGWGSHNTDTDSFTSRYLRIAEFEILSDETCTKMTKPPILDRELCARNSYASACWVSLINNKLLYFQFRNYFPI